MAVKFELPGETREVIGLVENDRVSDGTVEMDRAHAAEQEMIRGVVSPVDISAGAYLNLSPRGDLLVRAALAPAILRHWSLTPLDDRLLVKYASYREGYVCEACDGEGVSAGVCCECHGLKEIPSEDRFGKVTKEPCVHCRVVGAESMNPRVTGKEPCAACGGSGLERGVLAVPDEAKRDHSYGDIVSIGSEVHDIAVGDRVCFSKMAGIHIHNDKADIDKRDTHYCLMRRGEVMGLMRRVDATVSGMSHANDPEGRGVSEVVSSQAVSVRGEAS